MQEKQHFFPRFHSLQYLIPILEVLLFKDKGLLLVSCSLLLYRLPSNPQKGRNHSLFRKWKLLLFNSYNGQFKLEILSIFYFGYLFHKLSTLQDSYFMKPTRIFREIVCHIFHILGLPGSSERQYSIDSNSQASYSYVKDQQILEDYLSTSNSNYWNIDAK